MSCEATTARGERCPKATDYTLVLSGTPRRLCSGHARLARMGTLQLWEERPPVVPSPPRHREPWTDEEDDLVADQTAPANEVAARLGRSVSAVLLRRYGRSRAGTRGEADAVVGCAALTHRGERCPRPSSVTIEVDGKPRRLCTAHVAPARRGTIRLWRPHVPAGPSGGGHWQPWTEEEDALLADPALSVREVAARTGRTIPAVRVRRSLKRRGLV